MAQNIVATCVDSRMEAVLPKVLPGIGIKTGTYHRVTAFGCSLGFDHEHDLYTRIIENLGAEEIVLIDHLDCKAYKKKFGEMSLEQEKKRHIEKLRLRLREIQEEFPNERVRLFLLTTATPEEFGTDLLEISPEAEAAA